jgi:hypothetical protein
MMESTPPAPQRSSGRGLVDNPWAVLALLFLVMGVLGIPLLWWSRGFSTVMKVVWTLVVTCYTAALAYGAYLAVGSAWRAIEAAWG